MKKIVILLCTLSLLVCCKSETKEALETTKTAIVMEPIQLLDVASFKTGIANQNIQLIDVRTPEEFAEGHIENAVLIDFLAEDFKEKIQSLDKEEPVYLYCRSGRRSARASKVMAELGFKEIYDLNGGYLAWH